MNKVLRTKILKEINFILEAEEQKNQPKEESSGILKKGLEGAGLAVTGFSVYQWYKANYQGQSPFTQALYVSRYMNSPMAVQAIEVAKATRLNELLRAARGSTNPETIKQFQKEALRYAEEMIKQSARSDFQELQRNGTLQQVNPGLYKFSQLGNRIFESLRTMGNASLNFGLNFARNFLQIGRTNIGGPQFLVAPIGGYAAAIAAGSSPFVAGLMTGLAAVLAAGAGAAVGTAVGYGINKILSNYNTTDIEEILGELQESQKDYGYCITKLNEYATLGGYKYELGSPESPKEYGIGYSETGRRINKRTPGVYDKKDLTIIFSLFESFLKHARERDVQPGDPIIQKYKNFYTSISSIIENQLIARLDGDLKNNANILFNVLNNIYGVA